MHKLSVLLPMRDTGKNDIIERLQWRKLAVKRLDCVEFIAVDDGSPDPEPIEAACKELGIKYVRLQTADAPFSLARTRNAGIRAATGEYVYFEDLDFRHRSDFYDRLVGIAESETFGKIPFNFLSIPTLFLTEGASKDLLEAPNFDAKFDSYISQLPFLNPDAPNPLCDSYAPVGSNLFLKRDTCFHIGLFDEYFNSWGGEDREFVFRLLFHNSKLLRPLNMHITKAWKLHQTSAFEGWRSLYRIHGEAAAWMGLHAVHIHHAENPWKEQFAREQNFRYCNDKIAAIGHAGRMHILPAPKKEEPAHIFIGRNIVFYNDEVMNVLGNVEVIEPIQSIEPEIFAQTVIEKAPASVFFQNPYGKPWLKRVWDTVKAAGVKCVCAERGAFPGSIYFDGAFCAESPAYGREHWAESRPVDSFAFVQGLRAMNSALEPQGCADMSAVREMCRPQTKRNVLVLLQSLTDATTLHFTGDLPNYTAFLDAIRLLDGMEGINLLVKNHPLNKINPLAGVGVNVSACNIYELFDLADSCITLNSGAGLLALGAGIPVITMGKCFYAQEGLAVSCSDIEVVKEMVQSNMAIDRESVSRFYGYLINDFYSFADWQYGSREQSANTNMSLMSKLVYRSIKIDPLPAYVSRPSMTFHDLTLAPYLLHIFQQKDAFASERRVSEVDKLMGLVKELDPEYIYRALGKTPEDIWNADDASMAFYQGLFRQAGDSFRLLAEQDGKPGSYRAAGEAYAVAGDIPAAIELYQAASALSPGHRRIMARLAELESEEGDKAVSANVYRIARPRRALQ